MNWYQKLPPPSQLVVSGLISLLGTALVTTIAATYQSYTQAGHLDIGSLINYAIVTFAVLISKALYDYVPAHAVQMIAAYGDTQTAMHDSLQRAQAIASGAIAAQSKNVTSTSSSQQAQNQPSVFVAPASGLKLDDIQAISTQLAINLMHIAGSRQDAAPAQQQAPPPLAPAVQPVVDPNAYYDPMKGFSAALPAYTPNVADQATQSVPVA